jgi:hypothetical protein
MSVQVAAYCVINEGECATNPSSEAIPIANGIPENIKNNNNIAPVELSEFDKGLESMKRAALELREHGPRSDQLEAYTWFSSNSGWDSKWPLQKAAMEGNINEIKRLLDSGVDANCKMTDWFDSEPLGWAASFNQVDAIVALVEGIFLFIKIRIVNSIIILI